MLPNELQVIIGAVVLWLCVNGLKGFSELLGKDLSGWATVVAAIVTATAIFFFNQILAVVPAGQAQQFVAAALNLLVLLLGGLGIKRFEVKTLRK